MKDCPENSVPGRIIFVDKDRSMQHMMTLLLNDRFQIVTAESAEDGLGLLVSDAPFDIIISGFTLLLMNGLDFLRRVGEICPRTVRILMSGGCGDIDGINQAISEKHINRLVFKPFCAITLRDQLINDLASLRAASISD